MPGQFLMSDFVSASEEAQLLAAVDDPTLQWKASRLNGPSRCAPVHLLTPSTSSYLTHRALAQKRCMVVWWVVHNQFRTD